MNAIVLATAMIVGAVSDQSGGNTIGRKVEDFTLSDVHRRPVTLLQHNDQKGVVVVFTGTECPLANLYVPTLVGMHKKYGPQGLKFLIINSNVQDPFVRVSGHSQEREIPFPVLKDFDQQVAQRMGARRTPEAFLLDSSCTILYHGLIDDQYGLTYKRDAPRKEPLRRAIESFLSGKSIEEPSVKSVGCIIPKVFKPRVPDSVTYKDHIARILDENCLECHRPNHVGPFSLATYEQARTWSETIYEAVLEERMPPWHADPEYGEFHNLRLLRQRDKDLLLAWIEQDCKQGGSIERPSPRPDNGWTIGQPNSVYEMPVEFEVPATGVVPYKKFTVDPGFKEDHWVQAAEAMPGNREVVHHIVIYIKAPGQSLYKFDGTASTLVGWAPGDMPASYPDGVAKRVPAGSKFVFEMHYTPNGKPETDRSSFGLVFAKKAPEKEVISNILANWSLRIPAGASRYTAKAAFRFPQNATILSLMPHMHLRGVRAHYDLKYPNGESERVLSVPAYDFNWQSIYRFSEPLSVSKGTTISFTGYWDNSAANPSNPDDSKEVRWGEQTWDEMLNGWVDYVLDIE